jgi:FkbM family methyltransferase
MKDPKFWAPLGEFVTRAIGRFLPYVDPRLGLPLGHVHTCLRNLAKRGFTPTSLIDIGANRGAWSRHFKAVFPGARVILVEPQQELAWALQHFCREHPDAQWVPAAVSDHAGREVFTVTPDSYASSFYHKETQAEQLGWERREIDVVTLDQVIEGSGIPPPDVLKIDAEGCEMQILRASSSIWGITRLIFVEANFFDDLGRHGFADLVKLMDAHDYVPYDFTWFYRRPHDGATMLCEIAFTRRNDPLRAHKYWA